MTIEQILLSAATVEAIVQIIKPLYDKDKGWNIDTILGLFFGLIVAFAFNVDFFNWAGFVARIPFVGNALTAILISRGANLLHDVIQTMAALRIKLMTEAKATQKEAGIRPDQTVQ